MVHGPLMISSVVLALRTVGAASAGRARRGAARYRATGAARLRVRVEARGVIQSRAREKTILLGSPSSLIHKLPSRAAAP